MSKIHQPSTINHQRPSYSCLTAEQALRADWRGYHLSRKADGICTRRTWNGATVWGDAMRDGSLQVWEIEREGAWTEREAALKELFDKVSSRKFQVGSFQNSAPNWARVADTSTLNLESSNFLESMIEAARRDCTPDVCVAKPLDAPFGIGLIKIKLIHTYDVTVTDTSGGQMSVAISYQGTDAGRVTIGSLAVRDRLRVGDIIEIGGTLLPSGKFREPRFMRTREDKSDE